MAGLQIRAYVDGKQKFINLYDDERITIDVSFAEIQDITKKNSAFTKEFRIPGDKNNNDIFNYFFDINTVALDWNPKRKFEADLLYDGYEIFNGYVRLNSVTINKIEKIYSITFYSAMGDLAANIGDKALCDVDTSTLNHNVYSQNVANSFLSDASLNPTELYPNDEPWQQYVNPVTQGNVKYILGQRGYDYTGSTFGTILDINTQSTPILEFSGVSGFFDYYKTPLIASYFIPSVRIRTLYELIVNQAGYNIESNFFDTDYFGRYYLPLSFNTDQPYMNQAVKNNFTWENFNPTVTQSSSTTIIDFSTLTSYPNQFMVLPKEIIEDNTGFNPVTPELYPNFDFSVISSFSAYTFAIPYNYGQSYNVNIDIDVTYTGTTNTGSILNNGNYYLWEYISNISGIRARLVATGPIVYIETPGSTLTTSIIDLGTQNITNNDGASFMFITYDNPAITGSNTKLSRMKFNTKGTNQILPLTIELRKEMSCTDKQIEFIKNVNRMYNLVVIEHPTKTKTLIVEPMVNYVGKGKILDWTDKVDYDSPQNLYPTTSLINGSLFLSNKDDKDYVNVEYKKKSNKIFGQKIIDLDIDYKNTTTSLTQSWGQNTDYYIDTPGDALELALPCYFISRENNKNGISSYEYRPFRSMPRVVFASVPIPTGNTETKPIFYRYQGSNTPFTSTGLISKGTYININRLTTYPFAISGFSHYITYDPEATFTSDELVYPEVQSQYDRYYRDYIEDLISEENKIYSCKMYLTPWEVAQLKYDEVIMVKNAKFRINKISGLDLTTSDLCDVELVKLTREYTSTPTLYYDLISCDNPSVIIHSNTDINYLLWAFEDQYVTLVESFGFWPSFTTGRYQVVRTEYDPSYTYQNVFFNTYTITDGISPDNYTVTFDYGIYNSCESTTPTNKLTIINDYQ